MPLVGFSMPMHQLSKRGFTAAVRPGDNHELIGIDGKRDAIDDAFRFSRTFRKGNLENDIPVIQSTVTPQSDSAFFSLLLLKL